MSHSKPGVAMELNKRRSRRAVAVIAGCLTLAVLAAGAVMMLANRGPEQSGPRAQVTTSTAPAPSSRSAEASGFAMPEQAAASAVPPGHILELAEESQDLQLFWAGPPNSEWDTFITVERSAKSWRVTKVEPWSIEEAENGSSDVEDAPSNAGSGEAERLVEQFLTAVQQDRPRDAQRLTIAPLHEDPASTQVSNGDFTGFVIEEIQPRGDGKFWVMTTETWTYGVESWRYDVVSTRSGLRIRYIEPAE